MRRAEPAARVGWSVADRSHPAFSVSQTDQRDRSETYVILRHPEGGRKDVLRWQDASGRPIAELEIYRPGSERDGSSPGADLAGRMPNAERDRLEAAGVVESKFGTVALLRRADAPEGAGACLGFVKRIDDPALQISGWSCQGDYAPARRAAIGCMLDRLTLLSRRKRAEARRTFRARRTQARQLRGSRRLGLGDRGRKPKAARHTLIQP